MSTESKLGAPSKYKPEYCQMLLDYFAISPYREVIKKIHTKQGDVIEVPENEANNFPSLAGFAISIGVHRDTLHEWTKEYPDFSDAYKRAKDFQENFVIINGNKGLINPAFGIFTAKNVLKWRDKQPDETDVIVNNNTNNITTLTDEDLDARLKKLQGEK